MEKKNVKSLCMPGISGRNPGMGLQTLSVQIIPWFIFNHTHHGMNPEPTVLKNEFDVPWTAVNSYIT